MDFIMILKAILIAVVEGITEFLPISSTGHMILVDDFLKLSENKTFTTAFEVIIQLGAIVSVIVFFWKDLWPFAGTPERQKATWTLWMKVIVAVLPAVVLGLLFDDTIEAHLFNSKVVAITLLVYGIALIVLERFNSKKKARPSLMITISATPGRKPMRLNRAIFAAPAGPLAAPISSLGIEKKRNPRFFSQNRKRSATWIWRSLSGVAIAGILLFERVGKRKNEGNNRIGDKPCNGKA